MHCCGLEHADRDETGSCDRAVPSQELPGANMSDRVSENRRDQRMHQVLQCCTIWGPVRRAQGMNRTDQKIDSGSGSGSSISENHGSLTETGRAGGQTGAQSCIGG